MLVMYKAKVIVSSESYTKDTNVM